MISHEQPRTDTNKEEGTALASAEDKLLFREEAYRVKAACIEVSKVLGDGFLEKVYENALAWELRQRGFKVSRQVPLQVYYKNDVVVGEYIADLIVNDQIIIEIKSCRRLEDVHRAQLINYLRATRMRLGILVNFGMKFFEFERLIV